MTPNVIKLLITKRLFYIVYTCLDFLSLCENWIMIIRVVVGTGKYFLIQMWFNILFSDLYVSMFDGPIFPLFFILFVWRDCFPSSQFAIHLLHSCYSRLGESPSIWYSLTASSPVSDLEFLQWWLWRVLSFEIKCCVVWQMLADISEEYSSSILKVRA